MPLNSKRKFWIFHASFWLLAGLALFIYGLGYGHWQVALVRNIYSPVLGFGVSFLMSIAYGARLPDQTPYRLLFILGASFVGAVISSVIVNPITYGMLGHDLRTLTPLEFLTDGLYFTLLYLVWSLLYLQLSNMPLFKAAASDEVGPAPLASMGGVETINVEKSGAKMKLHVADITHIVASGDYVELFTETDQYMKLGAIGSYEEMLAEGPFKRIHRSIIVNAAKIQSVSGPAKGQYFITLEGGHEVRSSRNAQSLVETLLPKAH